ncbi:MAG: hypothetical protein IJS90_03555 [Clostridia bacterium]|nr:hypothetical protein [Clostridia bacterium]
MARTLYSLMLSEEVVREVDKAAHRLGTNRSNLINTVLAEYVGLTTPERRINDILSQIEKLMLPAEDLIPFLAPNSMSLSLKSSLEYKYRPTVKYEVQLYKGGSETIGELSVIFRTQSAALLHAMTDFFRLWKQTEESFGITADYALYDGKLTRSIGAPPEGLGAAALANVISAYIRLFDRCMKSFLSGRYSEEEIRNEYLAFFRSSNMRI